MSRRNWDKVRVEQRFTHAPTQSDRSYVDQRKPLTAKQRRFIRSLRVELGLKDAPMPKTNREGRAVIDSLLARKDAVRRRHAGLDRAMDARMARDDVA